MANDMSTYRAPDDMVEVTYDKFFDFMGPRNVTPHATPEFSSWETPDRAIVGRSYPGWKDPGSCKAYFLVRIAQA